MQYTYAYAHCGTRATLRNPQANFAFSYPPLLGDQFRSASSLQLVVDLEAALTQNDFEWILNTQMPYPENKRRMPMKDPRWAPGTSNDPDLDACTHAPLRQAAGYSPRHHYRRKAFDGWARTAE